MLKQELQIVPTGVSNFREFRTSGYAYVDKTRIIEQLEQNAILYPVLLRPRRFGKSLLVSMLQYYYDRSSSRDFDRLFAGTYIGSNRTQNQGKYCVVSFDFSGIDKKGIENNFLSAVRKAFIDVDTRYDLKALRDVLADKSYTSAAALLSDACYAIVNKSFPPHSTIVSDKVTNNP